MSFWDRLLEELRSLGETIVEWAILIAIALLVLVIGRWIIGWVRKIIERVLGADWLDGVWNRSGINRALRDSDQTAATIAATVVYAYLMVLLWLVVVRILRLEAIEVLLVRLLAWVPLLILAAIVVIIAAAAGNWLAELVRPFAENRGVAWLAWLIHVGVIIFGVLFAMEILDVTFAEDIFKIIVAAAGVAFAVAFGVGGIDTAKQWWSRFGTPDKVTGGSSSGSSHDNSPTQY